MQAKICAIHLRGFAFVEHAALIENARGKSFQVDLYYAAPQHNLFGRKRLTQRIITKCPSLPSFPLVPIDIDYIAKYKSVLFHHLKLGVRHKLKISCHSMLEIRVRCFVIKSICTGLLQSFVSYVQSMILESK